VAIIVDLYAREILDSRGNPTVEVEVELEDGTRARAGGGSARAEQWTMSATPATEGLFGQKTITGASGSAAISKVYTAGGTYTLPGSR